jgi:hypothetical protein
MTTKVAEDKNVRRDFRPITSVTSTENCPHMLEA